ncbi:MAG: hypothetical protein LBD06_04570 [Candidatus Accumulibacter sp.]|nr:hypothetical protein [Accumulibacter sp.]
MTMLSSEDRGQRKQRTEDRGQRNRSLGFPSSLRRLRRRLLTVLCLLSPVF